MGEDGSRYMVLEVAPASAGTEMWFTGTSEPGKTMTLPMVCLCLAALAAGLSGLQILELFGL